MASALRGTALEIKVLRPVAFEVRFRLGMLFVRLGGWIAGFGGIRAVDISASNDR